MSMYKEKHYQRRAQCRINQRRYRARQAERLRMLTESVDNLSKEIDELTSHIEKLYSQRLISVDHEEIAHTPALECRATRIVQLYNQLFRFGIYSDTKDPIVGLQEMFIQTFIEPDLLWSFVEADATHGTLNGRVAELFAARLRRYPIEYESFEVRMCATRVLPKKNDESPETLIVVESSGFMEFSLSYPTVKKFLPQMHDLRLVLRRVKQQTLRIPLALRFHFNSTPKVVRFSWEADIAKHLIPIITTAAELMKAENSTKPGSAVEADPKLRLEYILKA